MHTHPTQVETSETKAGWFSGTSKISLDLGEPISSFVVDPDRGNIAFLCQTPSDSSLIRVFSPTGKQLQRFAEPKNVHFNYLGSNRGHALAVMAMTYQSGWIDWWFGLDVDTGELTSLGEGR